MNRSVYLKSIGLIIAILALFAGLGVYAQGDQPALLGRSNVFAGKFNYSVFGSENGYHVGAFGASSDFAGKVTLSSGSATLTFTQPYIVAPVCVGTDQTANASVKIAPSTTTAVFTGTTSDVISYICIGQPN